MAAPQITITAPTPTDVDAQPPGPRQTPKLVLCGVPIILPCQNLQETTLSMRFLERLIEMAQRQHDRIAELCDQFSHEQILRDPDADPAEFETAVGRLLAQDEPPKFVIFTHEDDTRSVWPWNSSFLTHYDADGRETRAALVEPPGIVQAAICASVFGAIRSHHGSSVEDETS